MSKPLLLVDAFNLVFRSYYAFPTTITNSEGNPINVIFGFITLLYRTLDLLEPQYLAICWDRKEPTYRHDVFPDYKAHRPPAPDDLVDQLDELKDLLQNLGCHQVDKAGFEADDLMGTYSQLGEEHDLETFIYTGDMDCMQLVSDKTKIVTSKRGSSDMVVYDPGSVKDKLGVSVAQVIDFKALKGDPSDNIPGVHGIGDKTAASLLNDYKTLEGIYERLDDIRSKSVKDKLSKGKKMAFLSRYLVTISREVSVEKSIDELLFSVDWKASFESFKKYQFTRLLTHYKSKFIPLNDSTPVLGSDKQENIAYKPITQLKELRSILDDLKPGFAIDLETTSLQGVEAQIVGIALSFDSNSGFYVVCNSYLESLNEEQTGQLFSFESENSHTTFNVNPFLKLLKPLLEDASIPKYTHNGKYETIVLHNYGIYLRGISFDTMLAAFVLFPGEKMGLKDLVLRHLGNEMMRYEDLVGTGIKAVSFDQVDIDKATQYAAADATMTFRLKQYLEPKLKEKSLERLYYDIELPTQLVLAKMEIEGVCLDSDYLHSLSDKYTQRNLKLTEEIYDLVGTTFNINSTKQLGAILFDQLGLPVIKKTKTGRSTDASVLEKLKDKHPVAQKLLQYRMLEKLLNTYINALPHLVSSKTNRIHTSFNQTVALTGRLSSTHPNLQNIPIRTEEGQMIRSAFIPSGKNDLILSADYSQIELRLIAHLSKDENMINAFKNGQDIHASTAAIINNIPLESVTKEERYRAKAVNFGIIYGISAFGLSENLSIERKEAQGIIDHYFSNFPMIKSFMEDTIQFALEHRFVRTEFGRLRPISDIDSRLFQRRQFAERIAINTRVQGTAADIIKLAMINIQKHIDSKCLKSRLLIQVHDELVFNVCLEEKELIADLVRTSMEGVVHYLVPMSVDMEFASNWREAH